MILPLPSSPHCATHDCKILFGRHGQISLRSVGGGLLDLEIVAAVLVDFFQVLRDQGKNPALCEVLTVDLAAEFPAGFLEERALEEDLATGAATGAFSAPLRQELLVVARVDVGTNESANLSLNLQCPKSNLFDHRSRY